MRLPARLLGSLAATGAIVAAVVFAARPSERDRGGVETADSSAEGVVPRASDSAGALALQPPRPLAFDDVRRASLLEAIDRGDANARAALVKAAAVDPRVIEALIDDLTSRFDDRERRWGAYEALRAIGAPAVEPLRAALRTGDARVRRLTLTVLSDMGPVGAPAMPEVMSLLNPK